MVHQDPPPTEAESDTGPPRPQSLLLTFFGGYVLGRHMRVATASVLDVLGRVGVSEDATRSTLSRMARGGLLDRTRRGRSVYIGLTPRSREILQGGEFRVWRIGAVHRGWDGTWTLLSFSLPESWQRQRHALRSRLLWAGFGALQGGLWIAPSQVDVAPLLDGLDVASHVRVFASRTLPPTDASDLVRTTWDLAAIAARYRGFLDRWDGDGPSDAPGDRLARQLLMQTEWLRIIRRDPRLPAEHLPDDWPAERAQRVFRAVYTRLDPAARAIAADVLDTIPDDTTA